MSVQSSWTFLVVLKEGRMMVVKKLPVLRQSIRKNCTGTSGSWASGILQRIGQYWFTDFISTALGCSTHHLSVLLETV